MPDRAPAAFVAARAVLGLLLLGACSQESRAPTAASRLSLRLAPGSEAIPAEHLVARWDLLAERSRWVFEAPEHAFHAPPGGQRVLRLHADRTDQMLRVIRHEPVDTSLVNEVRLDLAFQGHGGVRLEFWRAGKVQQRTENVLVPGDGSTQRVTLGIPFSLRDREPFEGMSLRFDGNARTIDVRTIELVSRSPAALVPDPVQGPRLVLVDGEARRAVGLASGRPLETHLTVPERGRLALSAAQPPEVRRRLAGATLVVSVTDVDGATDERRLAFERDSEEPSRWRPLDMSLAPFAGRRVTLGFALETSDDRPGACVLAEPSLLSPAAALPTVLLVTTDTHRGDHLGLVDGPADLATPFLDALAGRGVLFEDCLAPINSTNPSHAALMTGEHPRDVGVLDNVTGLLPSAPTLAQRFAEAGYATWAAVSTSHLGPDISGLGTGFDRVSWPPHRPRDSGETIDTLRAWLDQHDGRPLFVWLHVFDAHWPYDPPADLDRAYYPADRDPFDPSLPALDAGPARFPADLEGLRDPAFPRAQYRAEITGQDRQLGRVFEDPRLADAITALVGDHGESFGEHGVWFNHDGLYPQTLHVPLILSWPGAPASTRVAAPVTHLDVGRTLLDLAGLGGASFPGRSLVDRAGADEPRFALAMNGRAASVNHAGMSLVLHLATHRPPAMSRGVTRHQAELYDVQTDPDCRVDLIHERVEDARRLRARLVRWLGSTRDLGWAGAATQDPGTVAGLAELGYTGAAPPRQRALWIEDDCDWCRRLR